MFGALVCVARPQAERIGVLSPLMVSGRKGRKGKKGKGKGKRKTGKASAAAAGAGAAAAEELEPLPVPEVRAYPALLPRARWRASG